MIAIWVHRTNWIHKFHYLEKGVYVVIIPKKGENIFATFMTNALGEPEDLRYARFLLETIKDETIPENYYHYSDLQRYRLRPLPKTVAIHKYSRLAGVILKNIESQGQVFIL